MLTTVLSVVLLGLLANDCDAARLTNDSYAEDVAFEDEYLAQIENQQNDNQNFGLGGR